MGGSTAGGLVLLVLGVYLLFAYLTGQLEWLFRLGDAFLIARGTPAGPSGVGGPGPSGPAPSPDPGRVS